jgi:hypothetical protein
MAKKVKFLVHQVLDGPMEDAYGNYWLLCRVEDATEPDPSKAMFDDEIPFTSFKSAYKFKNHFKVSIEPQVLEFEERKDFYHG